MARYTLPTYRRHPIAVVHGEGSWVWDADGKKYLDFFSGLAVDNLGHSPSVVMGAISDQVKHLLHVSNVFCIQEQGELAQRLVLLSGLHQAFFCNSGAEAIEACIKFARYASLKLFGQNRFEILVAHNSFHGRTLGALSATMQEKYQAGFGPLVPGFKGVPFNNLEKMAKAVSPKTCAILVEPIQGEGGVQIPDESYLPELRRFCDDKNLFLILDEVQTGMGRTGHLFAHQRFSIKPDLMALSKALGSGFPIGACLANRKIAATVEPGIHASTFGGNPLACRAALATLGVISQRAFLRKVGRTGEFFLEGLKKLQKKIPLICGVRGMGLMLACELKKPVGSQIVEACLKKGLLINAIQGTILRFIPPLNVSKYEVKRGLDLLEEALASESLNE